MTLKMRIGIFIIVTLLVSLCMLYSSEKSLFEKLNVNYLNIYTGSKINDYETILSGNGYYFICSVDDYRNLNLEIDGISFETNLSPEEIFKKLNIRIQSQQQLQLENPIEIYYCYIEGVNRSVFIENKKVNLQIAYDGEKTILGLPLILGSY